MQDNNQISGEPSVVEYPENITGSSVKIFFTPSNRKKTKKIYVTIEGDFTIKNISMVNEKMRKVIEHFTFVDIALKNITQIDLTAVQMLFYLKTLNQKNTKAITINSELSEHDDIMLNYAGLAAWLNAGK